MNGKRAHVEDAPNALRGAGLEHVPRALDVVLAEDLERAPVRGPRGEVEDHVGTVGSRGEGPGIADRSLAQRHVEAVEELARGGLADERPHLPAFGGEPAAEVGSDEA